MNRLLRIFALSAAALFMVLGAAAQDYGTAAVSTASGDELYKRVEANLTNSFIGAFPGLTILHGTGEPGSNTASYLIRGMGSYGLGTWNQARLFVDGFEVNIDYLTSISPAEIEKVEVLKDAAALAIYGEKGANGVISITTRRGVEGQAKVNARVRYGVQTPALLNKPLDSYRFATLYNQAVSNDKGMVWSPVYSQAQLDAYRDGSGVNTDWYAKALRGSGSYTDADVVLNGGSKAARYNINLDYLGNKGLLNAADTDSTRNLGYQRFNVRANLDFNVLKVFEVKMDIGGRIETLHRPNYSTSSLFANLAKYPSNIYGVYDDAARTHFSGTGVYPNNPYASVNGLGWFSVKARSLQTNLSVKERLDMITEGLFLEQAVSFYSYTLSTYSKSRNYARWYNGATTTTDETTTLTASGYGSAGMQDWKQGRLTAGYDRSFGEHNLTARLNWGISAYKGDGYFSFKYNTLNLNGLVHYDYAHRYIVELGFSEFGNDAFAPGHRWHFYPAVSAAWIVSNEDFLKGSGLVQFLKLRASAGLTGFSESKATNILNDFNSNGRYLYKDYYTYSYIGAFYMGSPSAEWQNSLVPMFNPNDEIGPEKSLKLNIGLDATLLGGLQLTADAFLDRRTGILTLDKSLMGYYGKQYSFSNIGEMTSRGFELSAEYNGKAGELSYSAGGSVSYATNTIVNMAEVPPANAFSASTGRPYGTFIGLIADGFYQVQDFDDDGRLLPALPTPAFGDVQPGDVKYLDLDGNTVIDQNDITRIGRSWIPEWNFSFGGKLAWRGFDAEILFQGVAGVSVNLLDNWNQTVAFIDNGNAYAIAEGAWAYYPMQGIDTRATATYPRLTTQGNQNNYRLSTLWLKDGSFIKLRNLEFGYTIKEGVRCFVNGQNLLTFSPLQSKYNIDPENASGGYPQLRSFNAGISLTF